MLNDVVYNIIFSCVWKVKMELICIYDVSNRVVLVLMEPEGCQESLELRYVFKASAFTAFWASVHLECFRHTSIVYMFLYVCLLH